MVQPRYRTGWLFFLVPVRILLGKAFPGEGSIKPSDTGQLEKGQRRWPVCPLSRMEVRVSFRWREGEKR